MAGNLPEDTKPKRGVRPDDLVAGYENPWQASGQAPVAKEVAPRRRTVVLEAPPPAPIPTHAPAPALHVGRAEPHGDALDIPWRTVVKAPATTSQAEPAAEVVVSRSEPVRVESAGRMWGDAFDVSPLATVGSAAPKKVAPIVTDSAPRRTLRTPQPTETEDLNPWRESGEGGGARRQRQAVAPQEPEAPIVKPAPVVADGQFTMPWLAAPTAKPTSPAVAEQAAAPRVEVPVPEMPAGQSDTPVVAAPPPSPPLAAAEPVAAPQVEAAVPEKPAGQSDTPWVVAMPPPPQPLASGTPPPQEAPAMPETPVGLAVEVPGVPDATIKAPEPESPVQPAASEEKPAPESDAARVTVDSRAVVVSGRPAPSRAKAKDIPVEELADGVLNALGDAVVLVVVSTVSVGKFVESEVKAGARMIFLGTLSGLRRLCRYVDSVADA
nr:uncharacterized protein [uncultured bacterium]